MQDYQGYTLWYLRSYYLRKRWSPLPLVSQHLIFISAFPLPFVSLSSWGTRSPILYRKGPWKLLLLDISHDRRRKVVRAQARQESIVRDESQSIEIPCPVRYYTKDVRTESPLVICLFITIVYCHSLSLLNPFLSDHSFISIIFYAIF